jgi:hypothetical protein
MVNYRFMLSLLFQNILARVREVVSIGAIRSELGDILQRSIGSCKIPYFSSLVPIRSLKLI